MVLVRRSFLPVVLALCLPLVAVTVPSPAVADVPVTVRLNALAAPVGEQVTVSLCASDCIDRSRGERGPAPADRTGTPGRPLQVPAVVRSGGKVEAVFASVPRGVWLVHLSTSVENQRGYPFGGEDASTRAEMATTVVVSSNMSAAGIEVSFAVPDPEGPAWAKAPPVPTPDASQGETHTSASYLGRLWRTSDRWADTWSENPNMKWVRFRYRIKESPRAGIYYDGRGRVSKGRTRGYEQGTRFTLSCHHCDGTVRELVSRVPKSDSFVWELKPNAKRGVTWVRLRGGTYVQATVTRPGRFPEVQRWWDDCAGRKRVPDATHLVDRWGEVLSDPLYTGQRIRVGATKVRSGVKVSRAWYVGKRRTKVTGRTFRVPHAARTKKIRLVVKVSRDGEVRRRTRTFSGFWDGR